MNVGVFMKAFKSVSYYPSQNKLLTATNTYGGKWYRPKGDTDFHDTHFCCDFSQNYNIFMFFHQCIMHYVPCEIIFLYYKFVFWKMTCDLLCSRINTPIL